MSLCARCGRAAQPRDVYCCGVTGVAVNACDECWRKALAGLLAWRRNSPAFSRRGSPEPRPTSAFGLALTRVRTHGGAGMMTTLRDSERAPYNHPKVPPHFGPWRTAALLEAQDGWCAICDEHPVPYRKGVHRFTCGRKACKARWGDLAARDAVEKRHAEEQRRGPCPHAAGRCPHPA
jgi:hypothetical protein